MYRYLTTFFLVAIVPFILMIGFNLLVDPYGAWHDIRIPGFNAQKPQWMTNQHLSRMGTWYRHPASNLILGSSRARDALDAQHLGLTGGGENLAVSGFNMKEADGFFDLIVRRGQAKQVIFATDFFAANVHYNPNNFDITNLTDFGRLFYATSYATTLDSLMTVWKQDKNRAINPSLDDQEKITFASIKNQRQLFHSIDSRYLIEFFLPGPFYEFSFNANGKNTEDYYRRMFSQAHQHAIDLRIFINPIHARHGEVIYVLGLWPKQEEWMWMMVRVNEEEAALTGKAPFPLWDFSGYNHFTTETVPDWDDNETRMKWYWESSHYKKALGDLTLDRVLGYSTPGRIVPADYGVLLGSKNLEGYLYQVRVARDAWRQSHPKDVLEIAEMAAKAETKRAFLKAKTQIPRTR